MADDLQPLVIAGSASEKRLLESMNGLNSHLKVARRLAGRINTLRLLHEMPSRDGDKVLKVSEPYYSDHPDVQMLLERARKYRRLQFQIDMEERLQAAPELTADGKVQASKNIIALLALQEKQQQAIEICLAKIRESAGKHWQLVAKMLDDTRQGLMDAKFHQDKMQLAKQRLVGGKKMANGELERIAGRE